MNSGHLPSELPGTGSFQDLVDSLSGLFQDTKIREAVALLLASHTLQPGSDGPKELLIACNTVLDVCSEVEHHVSSLRRRVILSLALSHGVKVEQLASLCDVTPTRVRQLLIQAKRERGIPVKPGHGGRKHSDPLPA